MAEVVAASDFSWLHGSGRGQAACSKCGAVVKPTALKAGLCSPCLLGEAYTAK